MAFILPSSERRTARRHRRCVGRRSVQSCSWPTGRRPAGRRGGPRQRTPAPQRCRVAGRSEPFRVPPLACPGTNRHADDEHRMAPSSSRPPGLSSLAGSFIASGTGEPNTLTRPTMMLVPRPKPSMTMACPQKIPPKPQPKPKARPGRRARSRPCDRPRPDAVRWPRPTARGRPAAPPANRAPRCSPISSAAWSWSAR